MRMRPNGPPRRAGASAVALLLAAGCSADVPPEVVAQDAAVPCTVVDDWTARWVPTEGEQQAKRAVFDVLDRRFPDAGKQDPHRTLREGFIGIAVDRPAREHVAVVDPALVDVRDLDAELKAAADAEHARRPGVSKVTSAPTTRGST